MIDNSSAFRRDPEIPLVVSEVNPHALERPPRADRQPQLLDDAADGRARADPPRGRDRADDRRHLPVGVGHRARRPSTSSRPRPTPRCTGCRPPAPQIYPEPIAFNVIGAAGNFADGDDHTDEERKMMFETRKILEDESIGVAVTCVRVPVRIGHSEAVNVQTREPLSAERGHASCSRGAPRVGRSRTCPTPLRAAGRDEVFVGRIRRDPSHPRGARHVGRRRQPAQGRRHQRGPDRRAAASTNARGRAALADELYELMRCAPSTRRFTDEPVVREVLERVLDNAALRPQRRQPPGLAGDRRHRS